MDIRKAWMDARKNPDKATVWAVLVGGGAVLVILLVMILSTVFSMNSKSDGTEQQVRALGQPVVIGTTGLSFRVRGSQKRPLTVFGVDPGQQSVVALQVDLDLEYQTPAGVKDDPATIGEAMEGVALGVRGYTGDASRGQITWKELVQITATPPKNSVFDPLAAELPTPGDPLKCSFVFEVPASAQHLDFVVVQSGSDDVLLVNEIVPLDYVPAE